MTTVLDDSTSNSSRKTSFGDVKKSHYYSNLQLYTLEIKALWGLELYLSNKTLFVSSSSHGV